MTTKTRSPIPALGLATNLALLASAGCREYTCQDLANCPADGPDASPQVTCAATGTGTIGTGTECLGTATNPATPTTVQASTPTQPTTGAVEPPAPDNTNQSGGGSTIPDGSDGMDTTDSVTQGTDGVARSSEGTPTSDGSPACPDAPGGVCQCQPGDTQKCALSGAKGACADGDQTCTEDGVFGACNVTPAPTDDCAVEGDDADCDGTPNSGCPCVDGDTQDCGPDTDLGQCQYGVSTCANSTYGECVGAVDRAPRECDSSQDNDCDGIPDDTLDDTCRCQPGDIRQCNQHPGFDGVGLCRAGNQTCELSDNGAQSDWGPCSGDVAPKASDSCVEGDNSDCVGSANTNCTCLSGRMETCGVRYGSMGICASVSLTCQANGTWPGNASCMAAAKQEICNNNLDENCDGTVNDAASCPCNAVPSPCAHGTCNTGSGSAYTCDCTGTGYEGTLCDKPIALTVAGPAEATSCQVVGVSDSGSAVAANCEIGEPLLRGYFWTANSWVKAAAPAGYPQVYLEAFSSDGTKAAASLRNSGGVSHGARWSGLTSTAVLLNTPEWKAVTGMSANGSAFSALDPGGNLFIWTGGGANAPVTYIANGGLPGIFSGDGAKVFTGELGDGEGFRIWTSSTSSTFQSLADDLVPVAASSNGSIMVGYFSSGSPNTIYKYNSAGAGTLNSTANCRPLSLSSDGRYVLGKCSGGLYRWADATPSTVQSLITSTGSTVTIRTDVDGRMSYNAKYVALPSSSNGIVVVHLPSP